MVPLWVSTSQSLTLETPSMGVEGGLGQVVALSHQESPLRGKGRSYMQELCGLWFGERKPSVSLSLLVLG